MAKPDRPRNPGEALRREAERLVSKVQGIDYFTAKHDGYTVTVSKDDESPQRIGFKDDDQC